MGRTRYHLSTAFVLGVGLLALVGCSSRDVAQVSGRVQYKDGSPVEGGIRVIRFEPTENSPAKIRKAASGEIGQDGSFTLFTRKPGDGVYLGEYAVTFTVMTSATGGVSLIKPEYNSAATTPYVVEVTGDMSDLLYEVERK